MAGSADKSHREMMEKLEELDTTPVRDVLLVLGGGSLGHISWALENIGVFGAILVVGVASVFLYFAYRFEKE